MVRVFADTVYWIALLNPRDALHQKATKTGNAYKADRIVTSEMVLVEVLNTLCKAGTHQRLAAARAVASLRDRGEVTIYPQTSQLFASAFKRYQERSDKSWSLTDCASFVIMEEQQLTSAVTHDRHFVQAGSKPSCVSPAPQPLR
jgi:predicted nucleic acid-binding protein